VKLFAALSLLAAIATPCLAQSADALPSSSDIVSLTPEQREAALEAGAARGTADLAGSAGDRRVHGEMGVEVGTGGERAIYGTAVVPIGQNGVAAFSYEQGRSARWKGRRHVYPAPEFARPPSPDAENPL
jgi:hypothetical protein